MERWRIREPLAGRRGYFANELFGSALIVLCGVAGFGIGVLLVAVGPVDGPGDPLPGDAVALPAQSG